MKTSFRSISLMLAVCAWTSVAAQEAPEGIQKIGGKILIVTKGVSARIVARRAFELAGITLDPREPLPIADVALFLQPATLPDLVETLGAKIGVRFVRNEDGSYRSYNLQGIPAKGFVRALQNPEGFTLVLSSATVARTIEEFEKYGVAVKDVDLALGERNLTRDAVAKWSAPSLSLTGKNAKETLGKFLDRILVADDTVTSVWPLTFTASTLSNGVRPAGRSPEETARLLNDAFGPKDAPMVTAIGSRLLMKGSRNAVSQARSALAQFIDIPYSQVKLDIWTIQANTSSTRGGQQKERAQRKMDDVRAGIEITRGLTRKLESGLEAFVMDQASNRPWALQAALDYRPRSAYAKSPKDSRTLGELMVQAGFNVNPRRPLTTVETLVFLAMLINDPGKKDAQAPKLPSGECLQVNLNNFFTQRLLEYAREATAEIDLVTKQLPPRSEEDRAFGQTAEEARLERFKGLVNRFGQIAAAAKVRVGKPSSFTDRLDWPRSGENEQTRYIASYGIFTRLGKVFPEAGRDVILNGLYDFFLHWNECSDNADDPTQDFPLLLAQSSAGVDGMLKLAMDALHADIQEITTRPMMAWVRDEIQRGDSRSSGIDLLGMSSLVVTSRQGAELAATAEGFYPFTPRPQLSKAMIDAAFGAAGGGGGASPEKTTITETTKNQQGEVVSTKVTETTKEAAKEASSTATIPPGTMNMEAALLLQALFNETETTYNRVAPGVGIKVVPFVLRDGGSARLQIRVNTAMDVDPITNPATQGPPRDRIKSHTIDSDLAVSALDLFELSTFGTDHTSLGDPSWRIPLLEQLPILGPLFNGPRTRVTKHQESLILVEVSILPKSLDLAGRYISRSGR